MRFLNDFNIIGNFIFLLIKIDNKFYMLYNFNLVNKILCIIYV